MLPASFESVRVSNDIILGSGGGTTTISASDSDADQKISVKPNIGDCTLVATNGDYTITGNISFTGAVSGLASQSVVPATTSTYTVGTSAKTFANVYTDAITINGGSSLSRYIKQDTTLSFPATSVFASETTVDAHCSRIGDAVTISIEAASGAASATQAAAVSASGIPSIYRPSTGSLGVEQKVTETIEGADTSSMGAYTDISDDGTRIVSASTISIYCHSLTTSSFTRELKATLTATIRAVIISSDGSRLACVVGTISPSLNSINIYSRSGSIWTLEMGFTGNTHGASAITGLIEVSTSSDFSTLAFSARSSTTTKPIIVYTRSDTTWTLQQNISLVTSASSGSVLGVSLSRDGNTLAVSYSDGSPPWKIAIYTRSGTTWTIHTTITTSGSFRMSHGAVNTDGSMLIVYSSSSIDVYVKTSNVWSSSTSIARQGTDVFASAKLSADSTKITSHVSDDTSSGYPLRALLYTYESGSWTRISIDSPYSETGFALSVALSPSGKLAIGQRILAGTSGGVYIYSPESETVPVRTNDASGSRLGFARVDSLGNVIVYNSMDGTTQWGTTSTNGWNRFSLSYTV
jgi:hypothetical protein